MLESGLPGRPNTSVSPRRPNHSGLPGFTRTRQNTSSTPHASKAGLTWSCGPTRDAAGDDEHVAGQAGLDRRAGRLEVVGDHAVVDHLRARALGQQPHHQPVGLVDLARLGRRAERQQLRAGDEQVQARAPVHGDLADPGGGERGDARERQRLAGGRDQVAGVDVLAAQADVRAGLDRLGGAHACRR